MVDPRIYRGFVVLVAFAVIVFGFSLQDAPQRLGTTIAPGQFFTGTNASMLSLAREFPHRSPGSVGDQALATYVDQQLSGESGSGISGFSVQTEERQAETASGSRLLTTVTATRPGLVGGTIVVLSHRDATGSPATAALSGTAVLLDLARALSGETLTRSVTLISTSGQIGAAGAAQLAASLGGQEVDAVIVLGDLASDTLRSPVVVPWSNGDTLAPPQLTKTLSSFVSSQGGVGSQGSGIGGQLVRLAFPFAITAQAPFNSAGIPAVLLSLSGDRPLVRDAPLGPATRIAGLGTAVLETVNALDSGPTVTSPSSYLQLSGKLVPLWAVRLLALALILPAAAATLDAVARTRRRGHAVIRWVGWVLSSTVPFLIGLIVLLIARAGHLLSATPPGAVAGGDLPPTGGDVAIVLLILALVGASFVFLRPILLQRLARLSETTRRPESPAADAAAVALSVVMCVLTLFVWLLNPFTALLLVPALHLWLWLAQPGTRSRRWAVALLVSAAIIPALVVLVYYANAYGLSPIDLAWSLALLPGGALGAVACLYWTVALGCLASAVVIALRSVRAVTEVSEPSVTVRGPATYAGPGSLGGTESALRR